MSEDYVSFEVAKLLKEKGFDWYCRAYYSQGSEELSYLNDISNTYDVYAVPTIYMAHKWLRSRGYHVEVVYTENDLWRYDILTIPRHDCVWLSETKPCDYMSYEYALQAGISEALKLM